MRNILSITILALFTGSAFAQGSIAGKVIDSKSKEAVIGANVVIQGTTTGAATDLDGNFLIPSVAEGTYNLQVSSITYKTHTIPNVVVTTAKRVTLDIELHEDVSELQEVVIQAERRTDTDFDLVKSIKDAKVVVVGITSEMIAKTLDRDAAQVLRRVPGITIRQDQFVQVRGLSERYNPVMLHNVYAPSVETDVRSFSFATLPSSQLDRMLVFKSPAADLPGDFAGGVVKVFTKSIPEENGFVLDYSTQYRAGTTLGDFVGQAKNSEHFTGFNTGYYSLPSGFPANLGSVQGATLETVGRSLRNDWVGYKSTAIPDQRLTLTYSRKFSIGKVQVGNISALNYSNAFSTFDVTRSDYSFQTSGTGAPDNNFGFTDKQYNQQIRTGFLFNWAFKLNPNHTIELKNLYNQSSNDQFVIRDGILNTAGQHNTGIDKLYRGIYSGQLLGTHDFFNKRTTVEWVAGYNNANRDQPDYRRVRTYGGDISVPNKVTPDQLGRFFSTLDESSKTASASIRHRFTVNGDPLKSPELKAGFYYESKERTFTVRNIGYTQSAGFNLDRTLPLDQFFQDANINNTNGLVLGEESRLSNNYSATNELFAYYLMGSLPFGKFRLDAGARVENNHQVLLGKYDNGDPANSDLSVTRVLPSGNLSYNLTDKMLVRAAYGQTLNRPEFREIATFTFFDFNFNFVYRGTPGIKTAQIQNIDLRWEYYPSKGELITFGTFYKDFQNPIETYIDLLNGGGGGVKNVFYDNAQSAKAIGVELEVKKSLAGLTGSAFLDKLNLLFNATIVSSEITIPAKLAKNRVAQRPMQGQAPYVINAGVFFNDEKSGWTINLLHNVVGKNIVFVGGTGYPDVYLMPRNVVDLVFTKRITERFQIKGGVSDILNQPFVLMQDGNKTDGTQDGSYDLDKDVVVQKYSPGQVVSLGFNWRF